MSHASKCDRCNGFFEHAKGTVIVSELLVGNGKKSERGQKSALFNSWDDLEFCPKCSKPLLDAIGKAIRRTR